MRRSFVRITGAIAAMVLLALAGCNDAICGRQTDCPTGDMCSTLGMCVEAVVRPDAQTSDGGATDAAVDAEPIDAPIDATPFDATPIDAATLDAF
jgi:hypothetical protein